MFGIKKRYILLGLGLFLIAIIVGPILINTLMFNQKKFEVNGNEQLWIPALATYFGALIGGFVSGAMTLFGVKYSLEGSFSGIELSLEYQEKERIKETIGQKLNKLYQVKSVIYKLDDLLSNRDYGKNENLEIDEIPKINKAIYQYILPKLNNLLELSASVDWEFYSEIKKFIDRARPLLISFENEGLDDLKIIVEKLTAIIEIEHENRLSDIFKNASTVEIIAKIKK